MFGILCQISVLVCNVMKRNVKLGNVISWTDGNSADVLSGGNASLWNGLSADDIEYYRARDDTRFDTLSDDGMPCEMDNQPPISRGGAADDSEMDNQAGVRCCISRGGQISGLTPYSYQQGGPT